MKQRVRRSHPNQWSVPVSDNSKLTLSDKEHLKADIRKNPTNLKLLAVRYGVDFSYVVSLHKEIQRSLKAHSIKLNQGRLKEEDE